MVIGGGCHCDELIVKLRDQITGIAKDVTEMRMEMKGMLVRNMDTSRIVMVMCGLFLLVVIVMVVNKI